MSVVAPGWDKLNPELAGTIFSGRGHYLRSVASTNDTLRDLAFGGAPAGTFVIADEQTSGRGRRGKSWSAPTGLGLYLSILLRPQLGLPITRWTLGAAVAACDACRTAGGAAETEIKWPNDLLIAGQKVGGILVESRTCGPGSAHLIVGIGINVHHDAAAISALAVPAATSLLLASGAPINGGRAGIASLLLRGLNRVILDLDENRWPEVAQRWLRRSPSADGREVTVRTHQGDTWNGHSLGLADDGALNVTADDGTIHAVRHVDSVVFKEGKRCS